MSGKIGRPPDHASSFLSPWHDLFARWCRCRDAAAGAYRGILQYCDDPVVSTDLCGNAHSSIFDVKAGMQTSEGLTKLIAWYDNEWGYAKRCLDVAALVMAYGEPVRG